MTDVALDYETRAARHADAVATATRLAGRIATLRLLALAGAIAAAIAGVGGSLDGAASGAIAAVLLTALGVLVTWHGRVRDRGAAHDGRRRAALRGAARVRRDWPALREPPWARTTDALPPVADDLRVVGRASIAQLLDVVTPAVGGERLRGWLLADPPSDASIRDRQSVVRELATRTEWLERCAAGADDASAVSRRTVDAFTAWASADAAPPSGALRAASIIGPVLVAAGLLVWATGRAPAMVALGPGLLVNASAVAAAHRRLRASLHAVADLPALLGPVVALMRLWTDEPLASDAARSVQSRLRAGGGLAALARLQRTLAWSEVRHSPMAHWALAALLAWDANILAALERWRRRCGPAAAGWLDALADAESLTALATLAHDNPTWALPSLSSDGSMLDADALGHPLLPPDAVVPNDAHLDAPGALLVVTGSNMAGKTTLLRAIGVNVVLAQAGGPVCARAMRWQRMRVRTSVHVRDALDEGVSLFLAELRRLKGIVDDATTGPPVLALLDEVLHGTNSRDRRAATRAILGRLRRDGAVTVVTTHDLELADDDALAPSTTHIHFREEYDVDANGPRMRFDYRARAGRAEGANAMALLAALGLGADP